MSFGYEQRCSLLPAPTAVPGTMNQQKCWHVGQSKGRIWNVQSQCRSSTRIELWTYCGRWRSWQFPDLKAMVAGHSTAWNRCHWAFLSL